MGECNTIVNAYTLNRHSQLYNSHLLYIIISLPLPCTIKLGIMTIYHTIKTFNNYNKGPFQNIEGKGENACNQDFLHFPSCFYASQLNFSFSVTFSLSCAKF